MNLKAISLAVVLAVSGSGLAHAATSADNVTKNGTGDVVLQVLDVATTQTFLWDLRSATSDLVAQDFYTGTTGTLNLTNTALTNFLATAATNGDLIKWRVVGLSQIAPVDPTLPSPNYGAVITSSAAPNVAGESASSLSNNLVTIIQPAILAVGLDTDNALGGTGAAGETKSVTTGNARLTTIPATVEGTANVKIGLGAIDFYYVHRNPTIVDQNADASIGVFNGVLATKLGTFTLGATSLSYLKAAPVPVPAAVWMLGSAIAGLGGMARRRRA